jgi:aldehyde dehydrogenase (NAD(P)+)
MSDRNQLDEALRELGTGASRWARLPVAAKRALLLEVHRDVAAVGDDWVEVTCALKGVRRDSPLAGEEWMSGPYVMLAYIRALATTLDALASGRDPLHGLKWHTRGGGQVALEVLPAGVYDRLLLNGYRAEVWMQPGVSREEVAAGCGRSLRAPGAGRISLVLGAGNISSIAPLDVLYKLYADGDAVVLKLNPVNAALQPVLERAFAAFVREGVVRFATGGADVGGYLAHHPGVGAVHMTGSAAVHDAIVFGGGEEGARRKAENRPVLEKPMTSELGGVSPTIVLPGRWSEDDLRYQAEHVATQKLHNSGFNCVAAQVLVLPRAWPQADRFLAHLREAMRRAPARPAFYPGAAERQASVVAAHPDAELLGGDVPRTLLADLEPADSDDPAFACEAFGPVLAITRLPGRTAGEFLHAVVDFSNERLAGTLAANLIAHPDTLKRLGGELEQAIARLRYGGIGVNCWSAVAYLAPRATWGGFPGATARDIQSGTGVVHNALLLERSERTVVRGPFHRFPRSIANRELTLSPKPPWFVTSRTAHITNERLTRFEASVGARHLPGIFAAALRG